MNGQASAQEQVVALLLAAGFIADGETPRETFRMGTVKTPIYGGMGGKLVTTGGRARYALPGSSLRVTVGPRSTCFYRAGKGISEGMVTLQTRDVVTIRAQVEALLG